MKEYAEVCSGVQGCAVASYPGARKEEMSLGTRLGVQGYAGVCRGVQWCAGVCRSVQGCAGV